jgi:uncharacterized membrane protein YhaH (DUF805 family)
MCYFILFIATEALVDLLDLTFEPLTAKVAAASSIATPLRALLAYLAIIYLDVAICVGRLHDMDMSGWRCAWILPIFCAFFFINKPAGWYPLSAGWRCLAVMLCIAGIIVGVVFSLVLLFRQGTSGRNRFGERPQTLRDMFRRSAP